MFRSRPRRRLVFACAALGLAVTASYTAQPAAAQEEEVRCYFVACSRGICSYVEVPCPEKTETKPVKP